jgi:predicted alpha/beta superfamily hydrolase
MRFKSLKREDPMKRNILIAAATLLIMSIQLNGSAQGKISKTIEIGESVTINSEILDEEREILVYLPKKYKDSSTEYPVLYVLDGNDYFLPSIGVMEYLSMYNQLPEMIVIGIPHKMRFKELTPTKTKRIPSGGGIGEFMTFIKNELIPYVEKNYRTQPFRIFSGHSLGGLGVLYAFVNEPDMFNAYIGISSSVYWDEGIMLKRAETILKKTDRLKKTLYFSVEDGEGEHGRANLDLAQLLKNSAIKDLNWKFDLMEGESHTSLWIKSFNEGLNFVSPWNLPENVLEGGLNAILKHYDDLHMTVSEGLLTKFAMDFFERKNINEAIEILKYAIKTNPKSDELFHGLGDYYRANNQYELALEAYKKGIKLAEENSNQALMDLFKEHIEETLKMMKKK